MGLLPWIIYILFVCRKLPTKVAWYHRIVFNLLSKKKKNGNFNLLYFKYMWKHTILFQEDHFLPTTGNYASMVYENYRETSSSITLLMIILLGTFWHFYSCALKVRKSQLINLVNKNHIIDDANGHPGFLY